MSMGTVLFVTFWGRSVGLFFIVQYSQNRNLKIVQSDDERKNIAWIFPKVALLVNVVVNLFPIT